MAQISVAVGVSLLSFFTASAQTFTLPSSQQLEETDSLLSYTDPDELFENLPTPDFKPTAVNKVFAPRVFSGYRNLRHEKPRFKPEAFLKGMEIITPVDTLSPEEVEVVETVEAFPVEFNDSLPALQLNKALEEELVESQTVYADESILNSDIPKWLKDALISYRIQEDFIYAYMIENPFAVEYAYWDLPEPPVLLPDDVSFKSYIKKLKLPEVDITKADLPVEEVKKIHWLHTFNTLLQFSQAYVSPNWYQGGNNYLALLFNFTWNVQLNQVYHPNLLFQSNLSYKLALSSNPKNQLHRYNISEDNLQYNLNAGVKAFGKWFYSFNMLFKTQILNNYEDDSMVQTAAFLSPGDLNLGLGMSYNYENKYKTFQITATISPLSYNLKTCISDKVDHELFNIKPWRRSKSEIGSNAEVNMNWAICSNVSYKTRLFLFSDYHYFLSDWEHTFSFSINKFLSTQIYVHLRYDTSAEKNTAWKDFMMREILSFGLSYTFSTKP